jgi:hypothetical protein
MLNGRTSLIFLPVCQIDASSYWCTLQLEGTVKLCDDPSDSNLPPCCLNWCPCCQLLCFLFSLLFSVSSSDFHDAYCWRGLRHELSSLARILGSWVRIPLKSWMSVCVCVVLCVGSGLVTSWSLVQGVLPSVWKWLRNWRRGQGPTKGCRAIDDWLTVWMRWRALITWCWNSMLWWVRTLRICLHCRCFFVCYRQSDFANLRTCFEDHWWI